MTKKRLMVSALLPILLLWIGGCTSTSGEMDAGDGQEPYLENPDAAPVIKEGKRLWAHSYLWAESPEFVVEKWLTDKPDMAGKYVLIEFWATWCSACRRAQGLMNRLQKNYGDEFVIVAVSDEQESSVMPYMKENGIEYHVAIDTQARMKNELGVYGIPHVIIIEPGGYVIWEGFPLLAGYELNEDTIEKILAVGRQQGIGRQE